LNAEPGIPFQVFPEFVRSVTHPLGTLIEIHGFTAELAHFCPV
jgi:hypothetical protein